MKGVSVVNALSNANNAKNLFFNIGMGYNGTTFYGDGAHDNQLAIMAAIAACEAAGALVSEVGSGHVFIPAGFQVYLGSSVIIDKQSSSSVTLCVITAMLVVLHSKVINTTTSASTYAQFHDFSVLGVRAMVNQQTTPPIGIGSSASCGVEIRQAQLLTFNVGLTAAFRNTEYGLI